MLERKLPSFALAFGPVQQAMRVEGVVDVRAPVHAELETQLRAARADGFAVARRLLGGDAVLAGQMLDRILALRPASAD